jgi:hypothetical protein
MLIGDETRRLGFGEDFAKERGGDLTGQEPVEFLGECCRIPDWLIHAQSDEPAKQQVVLQLLDQQALAADGVEAVQQQRAQQFLRRNRWAADGRIQTIKLGRQRVKIALCGGWRAADDPTALVPPATRN